MRTGGWRAGEKAAAATAAALWSSWEMTRTISSSPDVAPCFVSCTAAGILEELSVVWSEISTMHSMCCLFFGGGWTDGRMDLKVFLQEGMERNFSPHLKRDYGFGKERERDKRMIEEEK